MKKDKETSVWMTLVLLVLGVAVVVGLVGLALWYSDKAGIAAPAPEKPATGWGIATDSPLRNKK